MNEGFFTKADTTAKLHQKKTTGCGVCGLSKKCKSPKLEAIGSGNKKILIIGEAPSAKEDNRGEMNMAGEASIFLRRVFREHGIDLEDDCRKINAISCHKKVTKDKKGKNSTSEPNDKEIEACRTRVMKEIADFKPKVIILLGNAALKSFLKHRWKKKLDGINKWRGFTIPDQDFEAWVCPMFHPSYVKENDGYKSNPAIETIFRQDVARALSCIDRPDVVRRPDDSKCVTILKDPTEIEKLLSSVRRSTPLIMSFDYETTGLKPQAPGHRIVSASLCFAADRAYSFMASNMTDKAKRLWIAILKNKKIGKSAHNMKFEAMWTRVLLGTEIENFMWDSMLAAHVLDNRSYVCGLKFQTYIHEGVVDYDSEIERFLKATDEDKEKHGANAINQIDQAPHSELLLYGGLDSLYGYRITLKQMEELEWAPF